MSVLQRRELEESPLADLHAIASELGLEGYRALRREDLVGAILRAQGAEEGSEAGPGAHEDDARPEVEEGAGAPVAGAPEAQEAGSGAEEAELGREATADPAGDTEPVGLDPRPDTLDAAQAEPEAVPVEAGIHPDALDERGDGAAARSDDDGSDGDIAAGTLDILSNGSGFLRVGARDQSSDDVYVSPAQIRRCELRAGDEVSGPTRPPRRSERHPSLVRVSTVNGGEAEPPEQRPEFADLTPVHPTERLPAPAALEAVPFGKGSRVAITGGPGAGSTRLLREMAAELAGTDLSPTVVLVGARPEEVTEWERDGGLAVSGGSFDRALDAQIQAAELAVERAKRAVERGADAVVIIDSLEALPAGPVRRLFGAARKVEEGGSLTLIAAVGSATELLRQASTRITLDDAAQTPTALGALSGTQRADLLA